MAPTTRHQHALELSVSSQGVSNDLSEDEQASVVLDPAVSLPSQESFTQPFPTPSSISTMDELPETELDLRIEAAQAQRRLAAKRTYLAAIEAGEQPAYTPDIEPLARSTPYDRAAEPKRPRNDDFAKITIKQPQFSGKSWTDLRAFLVDLDSIFHASEGRFTNENNKVIYAASCFLAETKRDWTSYIDRHPGGIGSISWDEFERWVRNSINDEETRCFQATLKLEGLYQGAGQKFLSFLSLWESAESELPNKDPEQSRICRLLHHLTPSLREKILSSGIPKTWQDLRQLGMQKESLLPTIVPTNPNIQGPRHLVRTLDNANLPPSVSPATSQRPPGLSLECWKCGGPHYKSSCPEGDCHCGNTYHTSAKHADAVAGKWPPRRPSWNAPGAQRPPNQAGSNTPATGSNAEPSAVKTVHWPA